MTLRFQLVAPEEVLLSEIADQRMKQKDIVLTYALALQSGQAVDWSKVNHAIIERWSIGGLRRMKDQAWRMARA